MSERSAGPGCWGCVRRSAPAVLVLGVLLAAACEESPPGDARVAADTIRSVADRSRQLSARETLRIPLETHENGIVPTAGGRIASMVGEGSRAWLRLFDLDGQEVWSVGAGGSRPRFMGFHGTSLCVKGDTLAVIDGFGGSARLHLFDIDGDSLGFESASTAPEQKVTCHGATRDSWTALVRSHSPVGEDSRRLQYTIHELDVEKGGGLLGRELLSHAPEWEERQVGRRSRLSPLFAPEPSFAASRSGLFFARGPAFHIESYDAAGRPVRRIEVDTEPVPVTEDLRQQYREHLIDAASAPEQGRTRAAAFDTIDMLRGPANRPAVGGLWAADDGALAVLRSDLDPSPWTPGDSVVVDLVDADGRFRGFLTLPPNLSIRHFSGTRIYGTLSQLPEGADEDVAERQWLLVVYEIADDVAQLP